MFPLKDIEQVILLMMCTGKRYEPETLEGLHGLRLQWLLWLEYQASMHELGRCP